MQAQLDQASVRVPEAGQILKINTRAGETVSNDGIVELDRTDQMYARCMQLQKFTKVILTKCDRGNGQGN
ncbi:hypothetical protein [Nostoc sp.]|uniref:hypothetical protein n=1 Tax=Nostoc sp. TaxID=1180 RepID=UPI002FF98631